MRTELEVPAMSEEHDLADDEEIITCWCGATGTFDELFAPEVYEENCGGSGVLHCYCAGDFCCCHHHGQLECPGCPDCEPERFDEDDTLDYDEGEDDGRDPT
jgi:hypothetical protein